MSATDIRRVTVISYNDLIRLNRNAELEGRGSIGRATLDNLRPGDIYPILRHQSVDDTHVILIIGLNNSAEPTRGTSVMLDVPTAVFNQLLVLEIDDEEGTINGEKV